MVLLKNNEKTDQTVTLTAADGWASKKITNLPKYEKHGDRIVYSFMEEAVTDYSISKFEISGTKTSIENTYTPDRFCLTVLKVWDDANDQDKVKPQSITVKLLANGEAAKYADGTPVADVVLNEANHWTGMVTGLPINAGGKAIAYSWSEAAIEGYNLDDQGVAQPLTVSVDDSRIATLTNRHTPEETQIAVKKVWDDAENQDGKRPDAVTVELLANNVPVAEAVLNAANSWSYTFEHLAKKAKGAVITYTVREINVPEGYAATVSGDAENGFTVTNTHKAETIEVTVRKIWDDDENRDGKRPASLTVELLADGSETHKTVTLNAANGWADSIDGLAKYRNQGTEIKYTWAEGTLPDGYTLTNTVTEGTVTTLTNSHTPETVKMRVKKVWSEENNQTALRPASLTVLLKADGVTMTSVTLTAANSWSAEVDNLPKYKAGKVGIPISYEWEEVVPAGYEMTSQKTEGELTTIENTLMVGKLVLSKEFIGTEDIAHAYLAKLEFKIEGPNGFEKTLTYQDIYNAKENGKVYTLENLVPGRYVVTETNGYDLLSEKSYTLDVTNSTANGSAVVKAGETAEVKLTNTYTEDVGELSILKRMIGAPEGTVKTFRIHILKKGTSLFLQEDGSLSGTAQIFRITPDVPLNIKNVPTGTYVVEEYGTEADGEAQIPNYILTVSGTGDVEVQKGATASVTIVNSYSQSANNLTIVKRFVGLPENADTSDLQFRITGPAGFEATTVRYNVFAANGSYTLENVPTGEYRVEELNAGELIAGYYLRNDSTTAGTARLTGSNSGVIVLTNIYSPQAASFVINKVFTYQGEETVDKAAETKLQFRVVGPNNFTADYTYAGGPITVAVPGPGTYAVYEINANGLNPAWTLLNTSVTAGAVEVVAGNGAPTVNLTNNYQVTTTSVTVAKIWSDMDDLDESRPDSITMTLSNGPTVTLSAENNWTGEIKDLPMFDAAGQLITYTWSEPVVKGYTMTGKLVLGNLTVFTNTHIPELTAMTVSKIWQDYDNAVGMRPATLTCHLLANGTVIDTVVLNPGNGWTATRDNLPSTKAGEPVTYSWSEQEVLGYTQTSVVVTDNVTVFTNTYRERPEPPGDTPVPPNVPGVPSNLVEIDDYGTALGVQVVINHVGDCFD